MSQKTCQFKKEDKGNKQFFGSPVILFKTLKTALSNMTTPTLLTFYMRPSVRSLVGQSIRPLLLCSGIPLSNSGRLWMALRDSW